MHLLQFGVYLHWLLDELERNKSHLDFRSSSDPQPHPINENSHYLQS